jgi:hypothetical protein
MNNNILYTTMTALLNYKRDWNKRRYNEKYGSVVCKEDQLAIDKEIEKIDESIKYIRSQPLVEEKISTESVLEFIRFFHTELNVFNIDGERVYLTKAQERELHTIHFNDKVKINWCRQSGKDTVGLAYLIYLAHEKGKRILIDAPTREILRTILDKIQYMSSNLYPSKTIDIIGFTSGGIITITTNNVGYNKFDVLFSNDYDYNLNKHQFKNMFEKMIVVSKELKDRDFVESTINWDELHGRDECFKQKMIGSIGIESWNRDFEVNTVECNEEFTASNLRKIQYEIQLKTDQKVIEKIKNGCIERTKCGCDYYLYKFGLSIGVSNYLNDRGFNIEHGYEYCGNKYTKISW